MNLEGKINSSEVVSVIMLDFIVGDSSAWTVLSIDNESLVITGRLR